MAGQEVLLVLGRVRVLDVLLQPGAQEVCDMLGQVAAPLLAVVAGSAVHGDVVQDAVCLSLGQQAVAVVGIGPGYLLPGHSAHAGSGGQGGASGVQHAHQARQVGVVAASAEPGLVVHRSEGRQLLLPIPSSPSDFAHCLLVLGGQRTYPWTCWT